jgi:hypothetical protein
MKKVIDISGYGHSGKTAVTDLLREVEGINVHHSSFEFGLLRLPDGIIDLKRNIIDNWTPSKSDISLKRFKRLTNVLKGNYCDQIGVDLSEHTHDFINSIVIETLNVNWYDNLYFSGDNKYRDKIRGFLKLTGLLQIARLVRKKSLIRDNLPKDLVYLIDDKKFISRAKEYLEQVLFCNYDYKTVVTNNAFEPFNPTESMVFFQNAYCVIVNRDPRDIYLSSLGFNNLFIPEFEKNNPTFSLKYLEEQKRGFLGTDNIDSFIWRQNQIRNSIKLEKDNSRVLRINYEDIIYNYKQTVSLIFENLEIDSSKHIDRLKYFNPALSKKNVGLWKKFGDLPEIKKIEKELSNFLYK